MFINPGNQRSINVNLVPWHQDGDENFPMYLFDFPKGKISWSTGSPWSWCAIKGSFLWSFLLKMPNYHWSPRRVPGLEESASHHVLTITRTSQHESIVRQHSEIAFWMVICGTETSSRGQKSWFLKIKRTSIFDNFHTGFQPAFNDKFPIWN